MFDKKSNPFTTNKDFGLNQPWSTECLWAATSPAYGRTRRSGEREVETPQSISVTHGPTLAPGTGHWAQHEQGKHLGLLLGF